MAGVGTLASQFNFDATHPPDVPLNSIVAGLTLTLLVLGTSMWYVLVLHVCLLSHLTLLFVRCKWWRVKCRRFGNRRVVNVIADAIQTYYTAPFTCWTDAPQDHKAFWWNCFKVMLINTSNIQDWTCVFMHLYAYNMYLFSMHYHTHIYMCRYASIHA